MDDRDLSGRDHNRVEVGGFQPAHGKQLGGKQTQGLLARQAQSASQWSHSKKEGFGGLNQKLQTWPTQPSSKQSTSANGSYGATANSMPPGTLFLGKQLSQASPDAHHGASAPTTPSGRTHPHSITKQGGSGHASGRFTPPSPFFAAQLQHQHQHHQPHSPPTSLHMGPTVRPLRSSMDVAALQASGLPPPSPSKPSVPRFSRPPSSSLDISHISGAVNASMLLATNVSLRRGRAASSLPASPATSGHRPAHALHFSSPRTSAAAASPPPAPAAGTAAASHFTVAGSCFGSSAAAPVRPATSMGTAGHNTWVIDVGDRPGTKTKAGVSDALCALAAQQQQELGQGGSAGSPTAARMAWEPPASTRHLPASSQELPKTSGGSGPISAPVASSPRMAISSMAASPSCMGSISNSGPLPIGFEGSGFGSYGTLSGLNASRYTSAFGLAFAAESQAEMDGLLQVGSGIMGRASVTGGQAEHYGGFSSAQSSGGQVHIPQLTGEEPTSPHTTVGSARSGFTTPPSLRARLSGELKPSAALLLSHQAPPNPSNTGALQRASSSGPGTAAGLAASGLLSGSALAAHRAVKGPSPPPSSAAVSSYAVPVGGTGGKAEGWEGAVAVAAAANTPPAHRQSSSGQDVFRGPSMLRRSSVETPDPATAPPLPTPLPAGSCRLTPAAGAAATERRWSVQDATPMPPMDAPPSNGTPRAGMAARVPSALQPHAATTCDCTGNKGAALMSAAISSTTLPAQQQQQQQQEREEPKPAQQAAAAPRPAPSPPSAAAAAAPQLPQPHVSLSALAAPAPAYSGLPPKGIPPANYAGMLGCEVSEQHTAALPGYTVGKVIGEGGFCQVRLAVHHLSKRKVAVKVIDKSKLTDPNEAKRIQREVRVMLHLTHECVIKLFEVVDAADTLYLVMEYAPNQSLLDYVRARKRLAEGKAAVILKQIVAGLQYCHSREVVHRDVKLENILLGADGNMKIIDFGLSAFFIPGKRLRVHCGSPSYAAPEIVARKQYDGPLVDVWSLGVVLFACLAGHLPFHSSTGNKQELCQKIMEGKFSMPGYLSPAAKDLLGMMLEVDPERRISFERVLAHPWVQAVSAWSAPGGGSVYGDAVAGAPDEHVVAELELVGYSRQDIQQALQSRAPNYLTTSFFLLAEAKAERVRAAQQQQQQQTAVAPAQRQLQHKPLEAGAGSGAPAKGAAPSKGSTAGAAPAAYASDPHTHAVPIPTPKPASWEGPAPDLGGGRFATACGQSPVSMKYALPASALSGAGP